MVSPHQGSPGISQWLARIDRGHWERFDVLWLYAADATSKATAEEETKARTFF
jgi:hypothetical protein